MKRLIGANPKHFTNWLVNRATFVRALDKELKSQHLFADALLDILLQEKPALLHVEFQTDNDPDIEVRLLEYNVLASRQYGHRPVYTYVIYLRRDGSVTEPPYICRFPDGEEIHRFYYRVIKLWELPSKDILQVGDVGLLPLLTLTKDGKQPEVVKTMVNRLAAEREFDLMAIAQVLGGLVFKKELEREWFRRRFSMFQDILQESWVYQEIGQGYLEKGRAQGKIQGQREALINFVQTRFPEIVELAKQQTDSINTSEVLESITTKLFAAQTLDEARQILLDVDRGEQKH